MQVSISNTVLKNSKGNRAKNIAYIEMEMKSKARKAWEAQIKTVYAYFVAKVDVLEVGINQLTGKIVYLFGKFLAAGIGVYCIDYTQDFS